jgi:hypothetical protein
LSPNLHPGLLINLGPLGVLVVEFLFSSLLFPASIPNPLKGRKKKVGKNYLSGEPVLHIIGGLFWVCGLSFLVYGWHRKGLGLEARGVAF